MERLNAKMQFQRFPLAGSLELTFRCNLRCVHCYLGDFRRGIPSQTELGKAEIYNILDQAVDLGCLTLTLTGGEPFIRPDLLEIYTHAKRKGLLVTLFTNGTLITPHIAAYLEDWPPLAVEISLYGASQEIYERVTQIPGSYSRCRHGIDLLLMRDVPLKLKTMGMTLNQHELPAMKQFATDLGVDFRYDLLLNGGIDRSCIAFSQRLTPEQIVAIELQDPARKDLWQEVFRKYSNLTIDDAHRLYTCGAGLHSFHIDPYGRLTPCIISRRWGYDLRQGSFKEAWETFLPAERARTGSGNEGCNRCSLLPSCGQCPGWADLEGGRPDATVEYLCRVAHLRARAMGFGC